MYREKYFKTICEMILKIDTEISEKDLIENSKSLIESGLLDSITVVELCTELEERYNFEILLEDMDINNFNSIGNIVNLLLKYV